MNLLVRGGSNNEIGGSGGRGGARSEGESLVTDPESVYWQRVTFPQTLYITSIDGPVSSFVV